MLYALSMCYMQYQCAICIINVPLSMHYQSAGAGGSMGGFRGGSRGVAHGRANFFEKTIFRKKTAEGVAGVLARIFHPPTRG